MSDSDVQNMNVNPDDTTESLIGERKERRTRNLNGEYNGKQFNIILRGIDGQLRYVVNYYGSERKSITYYMTTLPDSKKMSELVTLAQGSSKLKDFAEKCDIPAPSIVRLKNPDVMIKRALRPYMIGAIFQNADPDNKDNKVTIEALMEANGFRTAEALTGDKVQTLELDEEDKESILSAVKHDAEKEQMHQMRREERAKGEERVKRMCAVFQDYMWENQYAFRKNESIKEEERAFPLKRYSDEVYEVRKSGNEVSNKWFVNAIPNIITDKMRLNMACNLIYEYQNIFLRDAWDPESMKNDKWSMLVCDKKIYEDILEQIKKYNIHTNTYMSIILIEVNGENGKVADVTEIPPTADRNKYAMPL